MFSDILNLYIFRDHISNLYIFSDISNLYIFSDHISNLCIFNISIYTF